MVNPQSLCECIIVQCTNEWGVSKNSGTPKWMVYSGKPYFSMDDLGVPLFLETPKCFYTYESMCMSVSKGEEGKRTTLGGIHFALFCMTSWKEPKITGRQKRKTSGVNLYHQRV